MSKVVEKIFEQRGKVAIIGLTGRTGSGCSTVSKLLAKKSLSEFAAELPITNGKNVSNDDRKYRICYNYIDKNWSEATIIKVSELILFIFISGQVREIKTKLERSIRLSIEELETKKEEERGENEIEQLRKFIAVHFIRS